MNLQQYLIPAQESGTVFNEAPVYNNVDLWEKKEKNALFITGLSGGGKGYIAKKMANDQDDVTIIELDKFENYMWGVDSEKDSKQVSRGNALINTWLSKPTQNFTIDIWQQDVGKYQRDLKEFMKYVLHFIGQHPERRFIVEGIQIYMDDEAFGFLNKDYPIIVIRTAKVHSMRKVMTREHNTIRNHLHTQVDAQGKLKEFVEKLSLNLDQVVKNEG